MTWISRVLGQGVDEELKLSTVMEKSGPNKSALDSSQRLTSDIMLSSRPATGAKETVRVKRVQSLLSAVKTARAMAAMFLVVL